MGTSSLRLFTQLIIVYLSLWLLVFESKFVASSPDTEARILESIANKLKAQPSDFAMIKWDVKPVCSDKSITSLYDIGIRCSCEPSPSEDCHITEFSWRNQGTTGTIPAEVANLTHLKKLYLSGNNFDGNIPDALGTLPELVHLDLSHNLLTGQIPSGFGNLKAGLPNGDYATSSITSTCAYFYLDLSNNHLNGSIPENLGNISVRLSDNTRTSSKWCPFRSFIVLSNNHLTGYIPQNLGKLKFLNGLYLFENLLSGKIPSYIGNLSSLLYLSLRENQLSGFLPPELGNLTSLLYLKLRSNNFVGELPGRYAQLANLTVFSIAGNNLTGSFPDLVKNWKNIEVMTLSGNNFWGHVPPEIFNFSSLRALIINNVRNSDFQFPPSANLTSIVYMVLRNCSITGSIPRYIGNMTSLQYLDLSFNKLTGAIPDSLRTLKLRYMSLAGNLLNGTIPYWITSNETIDYSTMDLSENNFSGPSLNNTNNYPNLNLFSCCASCNSNTCAPETRDVKNMMNRECPNKRKRKYHFLHINCGGEETTIGGITYDKDNSTSQFYKSPQGNWVRSSSGSFLLLRDTDELSDWIVRAKCGISVSNAPLYNKARLAPLSLKYYGFCLHKGKYNVTLHFAEIKYAEDADYNSSRKRIFNVDIQGQTVLTDFNIKDAAGGPNKAKAVENLTANVKDGLLQIHLYWTGKGSVNNQDDYFGPLISAISVVPDFKLGKRAPPPAQILGTTLASIVALLLFWLLAWEMGWIGKDKLQEKKINVGKGKTVTFKELKDATQNFNKKMEIGTGTYAKVYKAKFPDDRVVAVKMLLPNTLSDEACLFASNELKQHLMPLDHENVVQLFDVHFEKNLYFVYEYAENKSLAAALFNKNATLFTRNWEARFKICLDIAKGLEYLHKECQIVHRGLKAANILLDGTLKAKISDFGLATIIYQEDEGKVLNSHIEAIKNEASNGYMPPEIIEPLRVSMAYDVYSFGIILLEIVSGNKNGSAGVYNPNVIDLKEQVLMHDKRKNLLRLVDQDLNEGYVQKEAMIILKLAIMCIVGTPKLRPTMSDIVSVLTGKKTLEDISNPACNDVL